MIGVQRISRFYRSLTELKKISGKWTFYDKDIHIKDTKDPKVLLSTSNAFQKGIAENILIGEPDEKMIGRKRFSVVERAGVKMFLKL